jgi:hypothetical protein
VTERLHWSTNSLLFTIMLYAFHMTNFSKSNLKHYCKMLLYMSSIRKWHLSFHCICTGVVTFLNVSEINLWFITLYCSIAIKLNDMLCLGYTVFPSPQKPVQRKQPTRKINELSCTLNKDINTWKTFRGNLHDCRDWRIQIICNRFTCISQINCQCSSWDWRNGQPMTSCLPLPSIPRRSAAHIQELNGN